MNAVFISHFNYCPMIWMFHSRSLGQRINRLRERCLRIVYSDHISTFEDLLVLDGYLTILQRTLQTLAIEMFKIKNRESPSIITKIFLCNNKTIDTRQNSSFKSRSVQSELQGNYHLFRFWDQKSGKPYLRI